MGLGAGRVARTPWSRRRSWSASQKRNEALRRTAPPGEGRVHILLVAQSGACEITFRTSSAARGRYGRRTLYPTNALTIPEIASSPGRPAGPACPRRARGGGPATARG